MSAAGSYELVAELWDEPTSKPGQPFEWVRHRRGETVELSDAEAKRLLAAGAVVKPGEVEKAQVAAAKAAYEAALAALPPEVRAEYEAQATAGGPVDGGSDGVPAGSGSTEGVAPADGADGDDGDDGPDEAVLPSHLAGLTVADLKAYATTNEIDLGPAKSKAEIQRAIVAAEG